MKAQFRVNDVIKAYEQRAEDALELIGAQVTTWATDNLRNRNSKYLTANLVNSISWATVGKQSGTKGTTTGVAVSNTKPLTVRIGSNVVYAAIQEFGGVITPKNAKNLAIPVTEEARNKGPRDFTDLVLIKPAHSDSPLLVRMTGKDTFQVMYILVKRSKIPERPYLRPAVFNNEEKIKKFLDKAINGK